LWGGREKEEGKRKGKERKGKKKKRKGSSVFIGKRERGGTEQRHQGSPLHKLLR
jgi:hypothetical protein